MGRPLWSTIYDTPSTEPPPKSPGTWDPSCPFDPDSDAFFANAVVEIPLAEAPPAPELNIQPSFDWPAASSVERLNSLAELVAERRRELLDIMVRRRRSEALDSIRRAREAMVRRQSEREASQSISRVTAVSSIPAAHPSTASLQLGSSDRPVSPPSESRLAELQTEMDTDSDESIVEVPMQFAPPDSRRSREPSLSIDRQNPSSRHPDYATRQTIINTLRTENRDVVFEIERRRTRLREQAQGLDDEESNVNNDRVSSLSLSRQRRESLYSRLLSASGQQGPRSRVSSTPTPTATSSSSTEQMQVAAAPEIETQDEIRRSMAIAYSVFRTRRQREIEARDRYVSLGS
ncbi:hypothetical protein J3R30DRAFT_3706865 [Lentinula aciculospora]|uniref:Uncharacterized protein n=1 Tax=Lentinula aciculospora TaxID=153920 RepID=A0A9W9A6C1_9AGAR|nr:hypothetical protein J3R30DRAFT_3706865 [Lentinula aciculospora]